MGTVKDLQLHKVRVEKVLKKYSSVRACDKKLYLAYLEDECGLSKAIGAKAFLKFMAFYSKDEVPSMDTVSRVRRKLQERGLYTHPSRTYGKKQQEKVKDVLREF